MQKFLIPKPQLWEYIPQRGMNPYAVRLLCVWILLPLREITMASRLCGKIVNIVLGKMHAHVHILWKEIPLSVIITRASCDDMCLNAGDAVTVLVRGTDVMLAKTFSGLLSARNKAKGIVTNIIEGDVLSKVCVESQGDILHAYITNSSLKELCLREGDEVTAFVKSTELILSKNT